MRVIAYARTSTLDQASEDKVSIPDQIKWAQEFAQNKGWDYLTEYVEPGVKGYEELENREGVTKLLNDAKAGKFDIVLIYHSSRIAREPDLILKFHRILANDKVQVYCRNIPTEPVKKEDYYWGGNFIQQTMTAFAGVQDQQENVTRGERVRSGFRGLAEHGKLVFAPFGYIKKYFINKDEKREWSWEIDTTKGSIVEEIFNLYGMKESTIRKIMYLLNDDLKIPPPQGKLWNTGTIKNILSNPAYCGFVRWGRKKGSRYKEGKSKTGKQKRIITSQDNWILTKGDQPAIISKELFDKVQRRLTERGKIPGRVIASPGLITGLLVCGICGRKAYHKTRRIKKKTKLGNIEKIRHDYICSTYISKGKNHCRRHIISAKKIHNLVIDDINEVLSNAVKRKQIFYTGSNFALKSLKEKQKQYQEELSKVDLESKRLIKAYTKKVINLDELGDERLRIDKESLMIRKNLDKITKQINNGDDSQKAKERFLNLAKDFKTAFDKGSFVSQKDLLHSLLNKVVIEKNGDVNIFYKLI